MAFIEVSADFKALIAEIRLLREAIERVSPPPEQPPELTAEEREALTIHQINDADAWRRELEARRAEGELDSSWRAYGPRS